MAPSRSPVDVRAEHGTGVDCDHGREHACNHDHADHDRASHADHHDHGHRVTRRAVLGGAAVATTVALAGCAGGLGGGGGDVPEPVTLTTDDTCEVCGMVIPNHPGPSAEIFYRDEQPSGHANPAVFDSTWEAFQYDFERQDRGWTREVFYVTDYSSVDYRLFDEGGDTMISTHPEASAFVSADEVTFVVGSEVKGAMGEDLIGFSERADAEAFQSEHGGTLMSVGDVTPEVIAQLGRQ